MHIEYETFTLKNGLKTVLIPSDTTYSVTITALIRTGSVTETEKSAGLTHFIEHLALNATQKWPDKAAFNKITEFHGASYNGATSWDYLTYHINVPYLSLEFGLEFISQVLFNATFNPVYVEQERTIILDEISKYEDDVYARANNFASANLLPENSKYAKPIWGKKETIESVTIPQLKKHYESAHNPKQILLAIDGNFSTEKAKLLLQKYFSHVNSKETVHAIKEEQVKSGVILAKKDKKSDLVLQRLNFEAPNQQRLSRRDAILLRIVNNLLGGYRSSRLFQRLREKEGLLYGIDAMEIIYYSMGTNGIYYDVLPANFEKTFKIVLEEIAKFRSDGVDQSELDHIKKYAINRNLVNFDNIHALAKLIKYPVFDNSEVLSLEKINKTIQDFTVEEVNEAIKKYYAPKLLNAIAYGNVKEGYEDFMKEAVNNL